MSEKAAVAWPEQVAIGVISIPVALFFAMWFRPILGIPAAAIALWTSWSLARGVAPAPLPSRRALVILAVVALVWTWLAGIGGFFQQMPDQNFRNALLHDLIENPWPVAWHTPSGVVVLDYYLAWSLLPALVGKLLGWTAATLAMAAICGVGIFLVLLVFARLVGAWRWWVPLVFVLWSGMDILGWALRTRLSFHGFDFIGSWSYPPFWYLSNLLNFFTTSHLCIPTWIVTLLVVSRRIGPGAVMGLASFLFPLAPYQMVGILPFVAWAAFQGTDDFRQRLRRTLTARNLLMPLVAVAMCAPLYLANQGAGQGAGWFFENSPSSLPPWVILAAFVLVEFLVAGAAIWLCGQRGALLYLALIVLCLVPLRRSGLSNDLALKVSMPGLAILTLLTAKALLASTSLWARWLLLAVFAVGMATPLHEIWVAAEWTLEDPYTLEEDNIRTFDPGHHPELYGNFLVNFRSGPLEGEPLLRWMLGDLPPSR